MNDQNPVIFLTSRPVSRAAVAIFATDRGLKPVSDTPLTDGFRDTVWAGHAGSLSFSASALSGRGILSTAADAIATAARDEFALLTPTEALDAVRAATDVATTIDRLYAVGDLAVYAHPQQDEIVEVLAEYLLDDRALVRWAAARLLSGSYHREVLEAFERASAQHPDLHPTTEYVRSAVEASEDGTLYDGPSDSLAELLDRARAGAADGQWRRVEIAMDELLAVAPDHAEGLHLRALAFEATGQPAVALGLATAASEPSPVDDDVDEDLMTEVSETIARLRTATSGYEANDAEADEVLRWLKLFTDHCCSRCSSAMARAVADLVPQQAGLLYFVGASDNDPDLLQRALDRVADSPDVMARLATVLRDEDPARADELLEHALEILDGELSDDAAAIASFRRSYAATRGTILGQMTTAAYEAGDYERAGALADRWVVEDPGDLMAWQIRPNARTFALHHADAAELYPETLEAFEEIYNDPEAFVFGDDPRPGMHFNYACVLSKIGRDDEALAELRKAVRADEKWAEQAVEDDYFGPLMAHPDFVAITNLERTALFEPEELSRDHIDDLISRALGLSHNDSLDRALECAESAVERAEIAGYDDLVVRALNVIGRTQAFFGDPGQSTEVMDRSVSIARESDDVLDDLLAETLLYWGEALHSNGAFERAAGALDESLELKKRLHGPDHPYVTKTLGSIASLARSMEDPDRGRKILEECVELLDRFVETEDPDDVAYPDALVDHAITVTNLAQLAFNEARDDDAAELLEQAVGSLERVYGAGFTSVRTIAQAEEVGRALTDVTETEAELKNLRELRSRLHDLHLAPEPEVRAEQIFWRDVRELVSVLRGGGMDGTAIAEVFSDVLKGNTSPEVLQAIPTLGGFSRQIAERVNVIPTFVVTATIALELAAADGDVETALFDMEDICIAAAYERLE